MKTAIVTVLNEVTGQSTVVPIQVELIANTTGVAAEFLVTDENDNSVDTEALAAGTKLVYSAIVEDPEGDVVIYKWTFVTPEELPPTPLRLWGRKVVIDTTGYESGFVLQGTVEAFDRLGASVVLTIPKVTIE